MKKILLMLTVLLASTSCYDDYVKDNEVTGIYFTYQNNVRSFVEGEVNTIKTGVVLGGVMENMQNRRVDFEIAEDLISDETLAAFKGNTQFPFISEAVANVDELKLMDPKYYTLSDEKTMYIKAGRHSSSLSITINEDFFDIKECVSAVYALPLRITSADADKITEGKEYTVIGLKYEARLFGDYLPEATYSFFNADGSSKGDDAVVEYEKPYDETTKSSLTTLSSKSLLMSKAADDTKCPVIVTLNDDNTLGLSVPEGATYKIEKTGDCVYNNPKLLQDRTLTLNYKVIYADGSYTTAKEKLHFLRRLRDGVNEWRDENAENYK